MKVTTQAVTCQQASPSCDYLWADARSLDEQMRRFLRNEPASPYHGAPSFWLWPRTCLAHDGADCVETPSGVADVLEPPATEQPNPVKQSWGYCSRPALRSNSRRRCRTDRMHPHVRFSRWRVRRCAAAGATSRGPCRRSPARRLWFCLWPKHQMRANRPRR
jgi:hypothetical protein